ncbi:MAG: hypothetical protein ABJH45_00280 [Paracoccaceae bacterium]
MTFTALALHCSVVATYAATLQIDTNDQFIGALNVDVDGTLYDVQFVDRTCTGIVSGCAGGGGLTFSDAATATALAAGQALFDEVFINTPNKNYDATPSAINGTDPGVAEGFFYTAFGSGSLFGIVTTRNHQVSFWMP